jgi:hypothetical protein
LFCLIFKFFIVLSLAWHNQLVILVFTCNFIQNCIHS